MNFTAQVYSTAWWRSRNPFAASRIIKYYAAKQKVNIHISREQMTALLEQWKQNPQYPAEIKFYVDNKPVAEFSLASCAYFGDTCCASPLFPDVGKISEAE